MKLFEIASYLASYDAYNNCKTHILASVPPEHRITSYFSKHGDKASAAG